MTTQTHTPWYSTALGRFRIIAICEGLSFLILLFIAMPLKYFAGKPEAVQFVGWAHGVLFVAYMIAGLDVRKALGWDFKKVLTAVLAAFVPFGPFILDKKILSKESQS
jgi:integral membrane protein